MLLVTNDFVGVVKTTEKLGEHVEVVSASDLCRMVAAAKGKAIETLRI